LPGSAPLPVWPSWFVPPQPYDALDAPAAFRCAAGGRAAYLFFTKGTRHYDKKEGAGCPAPRLDH
jgi:hypothetical protein